jgi:hypothetical protein
MLEFATVRRGRFRAKFAGHPGNLTCYTLQFTAEGHSYEWFSRHGYCARPEGSKFSKDGRRVMNRRAGDHEVLTRRHRYYHPYRRRWNRDAVAGIVVIIGLLVCALAYVAFS